MTSADTCGCGHALRDHDDRTGECLEWLRYPVVFTARQCGCLRPWTRVTPPGETEEEIAEWYDTHDAITGTVIPPEAGEDEGR